jgi:S1-C subfamily serine protease
MRPLLILALVCSTAAADPGYKTAKIDQNDMTALFSAMGDSTDEPTGLVVANKSATTAKLGLHVGDVIRTVNGYPASRTRTYFRSLSMLYLEVARGKTAFVVRVVMKLDPNPTVTSESNRLKEQISELAGAGDYSDFEFTPITRDGKPSGVQVHMPWLNGLDDGDLVRMIDGAPVTTASDLVDALTKGVDHDQIVIKLDRMDQPLTLTINVHRSPDMAALIATIKRTSDTTYDVPKALRDAIVDDPMTVYTTARIVPAIKDGKQEGFKIYAIRAESIFAALGFANGDMLNAIDGISLADDGKDDKTFDTYQRLTKDAKITVSLTRRGKPLTLTYTVK